ncbi:hypothetical protein M404DRAFT_26872 [Pisolithus tinctorius Marx 270]|uniref:Uncharacterized protein n=1 Tax=Pisolithus tinctorius Marx 270 TaxID=870435 RepID=A0A0C3P7E2_PISTI|nr:hypothetical protein M404DRAFT_26872 [Pisolithus tinctorius Marx 270]
MPSQRQSKTPQPTPGHVHDYSQVTDEELVILTDDFTDTEREKECKAKHKEAKRQKVEEEWLEAEWKKRAEEEAQKRRVMEEEAERQRQRASQERAQARLTGMVYDINTTQKVPGASVVVTATRRAPCTRCVASLTGQCKLGQGKTRACMPCHNKKKTCSWTWEEAVAGPSQKRAGTGSSQGEKKKRMRGKGKERATEMEEADDEWEIGGEDQEEPATLHEGLLGMGVSSWWMEWEQERQLQAAERYVVAHEKAVMAFKRMARAAERMAEGMERTANKWGLYHEWAEWVEMRRREDVGWKRPQLEVVEDKNEEADEGAEGDNKEEEEVGGEKEGGEEREGGRGQAMEE